MSDALQVHVIKAKHDLVNDIDSLWLSEAGALGKSVEQLTTFDNFWDHIIIFSIFYQIDNSDNIWVRFFAQYGELILQKLNVDLLLLNSSLSHNFDGKCLLGVLVHAESD